MKQPSPRIFVVEDEAIILMDLRQRLTDLGYTVCGSAARGERALEDIPTALADVVLMDIHLAGKLDGVETAARLHKISDVPVVFLTAYSDPELLRQAGKVEPFGYLVKPFEERELHATLQMVLYKHRMERQLRDANAALEDRVKERTAALERSNAALRTSDARRREAQRLARIGHWSLDAASGEIEWCEEAYDIFGRDPATYRPAIATYYREIVHPGDLAGVQQEERLAYGSGRQHRIDHRFVHTDGSVRWVHIEGIAVGDAAGRPISLHGTVQDITERKQAEEIRRGLEAQLHVAQKRESEAHLASIIDSAMDAIVTVDAAQRVLVFNRAAEAMFRCAAADAIGQHLDRFIPQRFRAVHGGHMRAYAASGTSARAMGQVGQLRALRADGEEFSVEASISHVEVQGRQLYSVILCDITGRLAAEAAGLALEGQLRESQKMEAMGTLAGGIAHDFNNILAAILGNAALAQKDVGTGRAERALVSLEQIGKAGARGRNLVQQILTFSRKQQQELVIQPLSPLVEESLALLRAALPAVVSLETALTDAPLYVRADATQIGQVLMNLCTNAWHALEGSAGRIAVALAAVRLDEEAAERSGGLPAGDYARLTVTDDGCGMDAATQTRIFEPFYTTKAVDEGTGLGLAVVHGIVKTHRGAIRVESAPGAGTTVEVLLPAVQAPAQAAQAANAAAVPASGAGKHVLYVDDDEAMVFLVKRMLEDLGYRVSGHENAEAALAAVRADAGRFDLVVTDFNMPGASGLEVARELARIRADLPVVITSGYITEELQAGASAAGVRHVVYKPDTVDELCAIVQRLLRAG